MFREIESAELILKKYVERFVDELVVKTKKDLYDKSDSNEYFDNIFSSKGLSIASFKDRWENFNFMDKYHQDKNQ